MAAPDLNLGELCIPFEFSNVGWRGIPPRFQSHVSEAFPDKESDLNFRWPVERRRLGIAIEVALP